MPTPPVQTLDKALRLLRRLHLSQPTDFAGMTHDLDLAPSTAHRLVAALARQGFVIRTGRDRYFAGCEIAKASGLPLPPMLLASAAGPLLSRLSRQTGLTVQLGVLDEMMVTYLAKAERRRSPLFTREGMQLEAYCSAIGKVLLAALPTHTREAYLADGPFVPITANTITDPEMLRCELSMVRCQDHADDREEIQPGLRCIAVPVRDARGVIAALSASGGPDLDAQGRHQATLQALRETAYSLERLLDPSFAVSPDHL